MVQHSTRPASTWREARKHPSDAPPKGPWMPPPKKPYRASLNAHVPSPLDYNPNPERVNLVINLDRRDDRLANMEALNFPFNWTRLAAIDGRTLSWEHPEVKKHVRPDAVLEARYAESSGLPTICRRTGSFSPHLTLGAVGTALSHRLAWQTLVGCSAGIDYALVMEDDLIGISLDFERKIDRIIHQLPKTWQICYLGYHESNGKLLGAFTPLVIEITPPACVTGLFGYLIHKKAAAALLNGTSVFPLRHQIDVAMSMHPWPRGSRWAVMSEGSLIISPKSEVGKCDTDVQTLGSPKVEAHERMPNQMLRM